MSQILSSSRQSNDTWLEYTDADHKKFSLKWIYTWLVYTGEYSDSSNVKNFLKKRAYWEKDDTYKIRIESADPEMSLSTLISKIAGQVFAVESDAKRSFGAEDKSPLGTIHDVDTSIGKLWRNSDGKGTNWPVFWRKFASRLLVFQWMYVLVEGTQEVEGVDGKKEIVDPKLKLITPDMVLAKGWKNDRLVWVKVKHTITENDDDPKSEQEVFPAYTIYSLNGWQRFKYDPKSKTETLIAEGVYEFYESKERERRILPVFLIKMPFDVYIAHYLARKVVAIFNHENCRDTYLSEGTTTHLIEESSPYEFEVHKDDIKAGETHHGFDPGSKAYFIAPPSEPATLASDVIKDKREVLEKTAFQSFGDAAKEATATEIRQEARSGIEAFLQLFSTSIDEAENHAYFLLEQIEFPTDSGKWGQARVERSKKFMPFDADKIVERLIALTFGPDALPLTEDMILKVIRFIWESHFGFEIDDENLELLRKEVQIRLESRDGIAARLSRSDRESGDSLPEDVELIASN